MKSRKNTSRYPPPFRKVPDIDRQDLYICPKQVEAFEFYTLSDGFKRVYTDKDALLDYGQQKILNPQSVSFTNLFINGVLQPKTSYRVFEGSIEFLTDDIPTKDVPIILQMLRLN